MTLNESYISAEGAAPLPQRSPERTNQTLAGFQSPCFYVHFEVLHRKRLMENLIYKKFYTRCEVFFHLCKKELMCSLGDGNTFMSKL